MLLLHQKAHDVGVVVLDSLGIEYLGNRASVVGLVIEQVEQHLGEDKSMFLSSPVHDDLAR